MPLLFWKQFTFPGVGNGEIKILDLTSEKCKAKLILSSIITDQVVRARSLRITASSLTALTLKELESTEI